MIKVMVVEDEPPILRSIVSAIEATNPQFKVTARAESGNEAIQMLEAEIPDVIFTDIQMPVMNGLELIRYIREKKIDISVVILSGYSEFQYARKALTMGVEDYIVKPLKLSELAQLLEELAVKISQKRILLEREHICSILSNTPDVHSIGSTGKNCDVYLLMLLCAGSFPTYTTDYYTPRRAFWNEHDLQSIVTRFLHIGENVWVFEGKTGAEKVAVFTLKSPLAERADHLAVLISEALTSPLLPVNLAISRFTGNVNDIGGLLRALRLELNKKMIFGKSSVIKQYASVNTMDTDRKDMPFAYATLEKSLHKCIEAGNLTALKNIILRLFQQWKDANFLQVWVEKLLKDIVFLCLKELDLFTARNMTELTLEINEAISLSNEYDELFNNIWYVFEELFDMKISNSSGGESVELLMHKIEKYIRSNLTEPIDNQLLSEKFGLVPSYLSRLFREYKGMSPTNFLYYLRIESAKELITAHPDMLAKDISSVLGFCDPYHFSKVFKRESGFTPSEYKEIIK